MTLKFNQIDIFLFLYSVVCNAIDYFTKLLITSQLRSSIIEHIVYFTTHINQNRYSRNTEQQNDIDDIEDFHKHNAF